MMPPRVVVSLSVAIAVLTCCARPPLIKGLPQAELTIERGSEHIATLRVEVASTQTQRAKGLMGVKDLSEGTGMIFLFTTPTQAPFYMLGTLIPLDIAFWDESGRVLSIQTMSPCRAEPCTLYRSPSPYVGALEVRAGEMSRLGVRVGDLVHSESLRSSA